jgi:hypothetical protein
VSTFLNIRTYVVSLIVGLLSHWAAAHPGVIDPFYTGTLVGVILHALHMDPGFSNTSAPRVGGSV